MWPSFLRQVELKVLSNVCFRVSVCVPMAVRIFVSFIIRLEFLIFFENYFLKKFISRLSISAQQSSHAMDE